MQWIGGAGDGNNGGKDSGRDRGVPFR